MNSFGLEANARIGMNEWFVPQISEHCPVYSPTRLGKRNTWLRRPGKASVFTPNEGIVHEWITSAEVTSIRVSILAGRYNISLVFIRRRIFDSSMKFSVSFMLREVYSYDQYHWCPVTLTVTFGLLVSSIR